MSAPQQPVTDPLYPGILYVQAIRTPQGFSFRYIRYDLIVDGVPVKQEGPPEIILRQGVVVKNPSYRQPAPA
ncbi:hypothetical protein B9Z55_022738 [Caenorhabditis nigoni]|uniref:Uncharacterized protein n=1 Tax=Caenorhabditis nigoni TaxID=1611254 RepID=A0A2G5SMA6_9PELO|nr:hypothetical protein B9Z55_022738 [Caenorhabditis nigoni]